MAEELEQRGNLLDAFSRVESQNGQQAGQLPAVTMTGPPERIVGAQKVAVYRDERKVLEKLKLLAAQAGSDWYYRFPVKKKAGGQDWIEGASIKLANDLARLYGNCEVDTRVMDLGDTWVIYARFTDFESGFTMTRPYQQRKSQRGMRAESDRSLDIAFQIGTSKAIRNVVVNSLQTFADFAFEEARNSLVEKIGRDIERYKTRVLERLDQMKVNLERVERVIARPRKDWTAPDVARVIAMIQSVNDGMSSVDETFPTGDEMSEQDSEPSKPNTDRLDAFARASPEGGDQGAGESAATDVASVASAKTEVSDARDPGSIYLETAHERGKEARRAGFSREDVPEEYKARGRGKEAVAWRRGFDGDAL